MVSLFSWFPFGHQLADQGFVKQAKLVLLVELVVLVVQVVQEGLETALLNKIQGIFKLTVLRNLSKFK